MNERDGKGATPGFLVWRLATKWQAAVDRALAPLGVTHAQYALLGSLRGMARAHVHPSQRELADHVGLEAMFVSKLVRTLEDKEIVTRGQHPDDPRAVEVRLTRAGLALADRAIERVRALQEDLLEPLGGLESPATSRFADTLQKLLERSTS
jgi:DNA-binding MarR family transcriptional regulator